MHLFVWNELFAFPPNDHSGFVSPFCVCIVWGDIILTFDYLSIYHKFIFFVLGKVKTWHLIEFNLYKLFQDNVFVNVVASVQYRALADKAYDAFYKLSNTRGQIQAYVFDGK